MTGYVKLDCGVQHYAWGKTASESFVAKMKHETDDTRRYAELWVGTHVNCPSHLQSGQLLEDYLREPSVATRFFSPAQQRTAEFRDKVPFLLKVLSVQTALSIQAHPCKQLAVKLHRENPSKYKDPNHKPELLVALTRFEALCCFRPLHEILRLVESAKPLKSLLGKVTTVSTKEKETSVIKAMMHVVYDVNPELQTKALREHAAAVRVKGEAASMEDRLFLRLMSQYPDDIGCWMVYFLNYVQMEPGQGLFLEDSEPHAYLHGDGVEVMASSDNVVRAGLTPKWKDVPTLLGMLRYNTDGLERAKYERHRAAGKESWEVQRYCPPARFPEFSLYRLQHVAQTKGKTCVQLPSVGLGFCVAGKGVVNGTPVTKGDCFAVPYGTLTCEADGSCVLFVASTNDLPPPPAHM
ncbi:putative phosphomannose isomerase [Trypanosoma rangeli]|uniref:mannose-6-phosphate isomerase n=1 Tax=Trypanosoma rangeli TaxID=5698 RepID=A0A3R7KE75_TRYRA|nr:putative phosphomannose isomerase [Trypanosoma rangeli]RNF06227.1 putative phosphomannose isomerase [Trypanosoma rangeli]|eukprot:RNF06227.1 putative phosphomannose isomerase [Trypanosoma rangeli]